MSVLLEARDLTVSFPASGRQARPVEGASFDIKEGERVGLVGESGSGKSTLGLALLRLLPEIHGLRLSGALRFRGESVLEMSPRRLSTYRGREVAMVFQDPTTALNPTMTIGRQIGETEPDGRARAERIRSALAAVGVPDPEQRARSWPHQLSGGLRQRAATAVAIASSPSLLVADEPTTALDAGVQLAVIDMLADLSTGRNTALLLITHDLALVARVCERVMVMYAGQIVEEGPTQTVFARPRHWYTAALIACARSAEAPGPRFATIPGQPPGLFDRSAGCRFAPRCPVVGHECAGGPPSREGETSVRCWRPRDSTS